MTDQTILINRSAATSAPSSLDYGELAISFTGGRSKLFVGNVSLAPVELTTIANIGGMGSGVATFLATPSSANLASALTDKTGTGNAVFSTNAVLTGTAGTIDGYTIGGTTRAPASFTTTNATKFSYGSVSDLSTLNSNGIFQAVMGNADGTPVIAAAVASSSSGIGPSLNFYRSRGTISSQTNVANGDNIFSISGGARAGTDSSAGRADITYYVDEPGGVTNGDCGTSIYFTITPRTTIDSDVAILKLRSDLSAEFAGDIKTTGSLGTTGARLTKGWFTDLQVTNAIAASITGSAPTLTTARAIYGNNFDGSAALTQIISSAYGGTGNGFTKFEGATTTEKIYTLPDSSATILYEGGAIGSTTPSTGAFTTLFAKRSVVAAPTIPESLELTAAQSRQVVTNIGVVDDNGLAQLPSAEAGLEFTFVCQDALGIKALAAIGDTISDLGTTSYSGGGIYSYTVNSVVTLLAINSTQWIVSSKNGSWAIDT